MSNVNVTILLNAQMQQVAAVKDDAAQVRKLLDAARKRGVEDINWIKFTGANGRELHMSEEVWLSIAAINEVIVENQEPKSDIVIAKPMPEGFRAN